MYCVYISVQYCGDVVQPFCIENTVSLSIQPENPSIVKINIHLHGTQNRGHYNLQLTNPILKLKTIQRETGA